MHSRTVRHFAVDHNPRREIEQIRALLDNHGIPRMCADETAAMSTVDRVKSVLVELRKARGTIARHDNAEAQPVDLGEVQFRA